MYFHEVKETMSTKVSSWTFKMHIITVGDSLKMHELQE